MPTGTECAPDEGPIESIAGDKAVGWIFTDYTDKGYTITVPASPNTSDEPTVYLVHDVAAETVTWKRVGGFMPALIPSNAFWKLEPVD